MPIRAGVAYVDILPRLAGFQAALNKSIGRIATKMDKVGKSLTRTITLPIVAAGAASAKLAVDFEATMTKIQALVGLSGEEVKKLSEQVLQLAPALGKGPRELGEALYYVTSAGFSANEALSVVTAAAKASAAGLGDTQTVADAVVSAIGAYGKENLSASQATDVLTATIRLGRNEADQLAGVIGRVIPVAANMGVEFHEVGAAIAAMSLTGFDAAEATTSLRQFLVLLTKPAQQSRKALDELGLTAGDVAQLTQRLDLTLAKGGLSVAKLRDIVANQGLFEGMEALKTSLGGNLDALGQVIPNVRALTGFLSVTGSRAEENADIFRQLAVATGESERAFRVTTDTAKFKFNQALAQLQVTAIETGNIILPTILRIVEMIGKLAKGFADLPKPMQETIIKVLVVAAVMGPLLRVGSILLRTFGLLVGAASKFVTGLVFVGRAVQALSIAMGISATAMAAALGGVIGIAGGLLIAINKIKEANDATADSFLTKTIPALLETGGVLQITAHQWRLGPFGGNDIGKTEEVFRKLRDGAITGAQAFQQLAKIAGVSQEQIRNVAIEQIRVGVTANIASKEFSQVGTIIQTAMQLGIINAQQLGQILGENAIKGAQLAQVLAQVPASMRAAVQAAAAAAKPLNAALGTSIADLPKIALPKLPKIKTGGGILGVGGGKAETERKNIAERLADAVADLAIPKFKKILAKAITAALPAAADAMEGLRDRLRTLTEAAIDANKKGLVSDSSIKKLQKLNRTAANLSARLSALVEQMEKLNSSINQGFDRFADFGDLLENATPSKILKNFTERAASAKEFAALLQQAAQRGLSLDIISQAAQAGPEALPFLRSLQALSAEQIKQLNAQQAAINAARQATIKALDEKYFGPAFRALSKEINKFASTLNSFVAALRKIIRKIAPGIKLAEGGLVTSPTIALVGEGGPEAVIPLDVLKAGFGQGPTIHVTVEGSLVTERELQTAIREAYLAIARRNTRVGLA